jgi:5-methylcytosine-specific restriction protein B
MRFKVIPLLQEYFFEDWSRIHAVLGPGFIEGTSLPAPPGIEERSERKSWRVRETFADDAYERLLDKGGDLFAGPNDMATEDAG